MLAGFEPLFFHAMQQHLLTDTGCTPNVPMASTRLPQWLACTANDACDADAFTAQVHQLTGMGLQALHVQDAVNTLHPSHYDGMPDYDMVVFRSLHSQHRMPVPSKQRRLQAISTQPMTFFISDRALVTVHHGDTPNQTTPLPPNVERLKTALSPHQLMLRLINTQVDAYLELRQPLTDQLDRWQRELLDPRRAFNDWTALLDARLELRKLESLSEEQMDALSELREAWSEPLALPYHAAEIASLRVRLSDLIEHLERVLNHAKRLESSVESAIQLHFAAVAHQTNHTVRNLTILTAVFAPLTLITGFYGMNVPLPWQQSPSAYVWLVGAMALSAGVVLGCIFTTRFLHRRRG